MQANFELLTRRELEDADPAFLWPSDPASVAVMPRAVWDLVRRNPDHPPDLPAAATLSVDGRRVVTMALIQQTLRLGSRECRTLCGHSLWCHPDGRAEGIGGFLLRELLAALKPLGLPLFAYGATPYANKLMTALRMTRVGLAPRWIMPLRSGPILRKYAGTGMLQRAAATVADLPLRAFVGAQRARLRRATTRYTLEERAAFTATPDIDDPAAPARIHVRRTPAFLEWKREFVGHDASARGGAYYLVDDSGRDVACFLLRVATHPRVGGQLFEDVRIARVLDLLLPPSDEVARVALYHLLRVAARERADVLELLTSDARVGALCRSIGCRQSNGYELMLSRSSSLPPEAYCYDRWFLTMVESEAAFSS